MADERFQPRRILEILVEHGVDFVLVGGVAGAARGSAYVTLDIDVAYERSRANVARLTTALARLDVSLRGAPADVPFQLEAWTLSEGANFTFDTIFGPLDVLGDIPGAPPYEALKRGAGKPLDVEGTPVYVASLDQLIAMKEAAGRPKDLLQASEYRMISDILRAPPVE